MDDHEGGSKSLEGKKSLVSKKQSNLKIVPVPNSPNDIQRGLLQLQKKVKPYK